MLASCGSDTDTGGGEGPTPSEVDATVDSPTPTGPVIEKNASYGTVADLRDAVVAAGYECPEYAERETVTMASEGADCGGDTVPLVHPSESTRDANLEFLKSARQCHFPCRS